MTVTPFLFFFYPTLKQSLDETQSMSIHRISIYDKINIRDLLKSLFPVVKPDPQRQG